MADRRTPSRNRNRRSSGDGRIQRSRSFYHAQLDALAEWLPAGGARRLRRFDTALIALEQRLDRANAAGLARYRRFEHRFRSQLASRIRDLERVVARGGRRSAQA